MCPGLQTRLIRPCWELGWSRIFSDRYVFWKNFLSILKNVENFSYKVIIFLHVKWPHFSISAKWCVTILNCLFLLNCLHCFILNNYGLLFIPSFLESGFVLLNPTTFWTDLFVRNFVYHSDDKIRDDLLFFVRKHQKRTSARYIPKFEVNIINFFKSLILMYRNLYMFNKIVNIQYAFWMTCCLLNFIFF